MNLASAASVRSMSIGVGIATGLYGISFGALSVASGFDLLQTQLLSLLMFSGGSQFAFIGVFATGGMGAIGTAVASAWLLGVRNGFYAVRMAPVLDVAKGWRLVAAQLTIDESTGVSTAQSELPEQRSGFWLTGASVFVFWNLATLLGALVGSSLGDPKFWGLDAAAAAAFLGLLWPRLSQSQSLVVAIGSMIVACALTPWLPPGVPILLAGVVAVVVGTLNIFKAKEVAE